MLQSVAVAPKKLADYRPIVGEEAVEELRSLAAPLRGARILHVNATAFGGGVAEILYTLVPLMRDVGLDAHWQVISGEEEFFNVTKAIHNGLQGMDVPFTEEMRRIYERYNRLNAERFEGDYDIVVVHDPQPAALVRYTGGKGGKVWVWRCHIDTSTPNPAFWEFLLDLIRPYDAHIFTMREFVGPGLESKHLAIIPPSIDPLSDKNAPMDDGEIEAIVSGFGVDLSRPLLLQVSRFDPWKDPLGVIDAYRLVKREFSGAQLALVGSMASDDPEGWFYCDRTLRHAGEDFDIFVLHNFHGVGAREVNAFQRAADVVIQKSTREGFGLVVTEALWKGKPVVGGRAGGIPLQVIDGETGFLVESVEECAQKALYLLRHPEKAKEMGQKGKEHVRRNFLITRHLRDYLELFRTLLRC